MRLRIRPLTVDATEARRWAWGLVAASIPWLLLRIVALSLAAVAFLFICSLFVLAPPKDPLNCWTIRQQNSATRRACGDHFTSEPEGGYRTVTLYDHQDRVTGVYTGVWSVEPDR